MNKYPPLLSTRLKIPKPRPNYLIRDSLFARLDSLKDFRVVLIKGGAGSGKTTLITTYAQERNLKRLKWVSLDKGCNHPLLFWNYVAAALGEFSGSHQDDLLALFRSNFDKNQLKDLLIQTINLLDQDQDIYLVLDDFHHLQDAFLLETFEFFLQSMPENLRLILLTRQEPAIYLGALHMQGTLMTIDHDDLKLDQESAYRFLTETLQLPPDHPPLTEMIQLAQGWIGGLQLMGLQPKAFPSNVDNRVIADYFTKELLATLEAEETEFLVATSTLPDISKAMAEGLFPHISFEGLIQNLQHKNIPFTCLEEKEGVYGCHPLLKEHLMALFKQWPSAKQSHLHQRAATLYRDQFQYHLCLEQLLLAGLYHQAMELIMSTREDLTLFAYAERIPVSEITENPDFLYQSFFYHYINHEFQRCTSLYLPLEKRMQQDPVYFPMQMSRGFIEADHDLNALPVLPMDQLEALPLLPLTKSYLLLRDAALLHTRKEFKEALAYVRQALKHSPKNNSTHLFFAYGIQSQILEDLGELNQCHRLYQDMHRMLSVLPSAAMHHTSYHIGKAGLYLKQMKCEDALYCLEEAKNHLLEPFSNASLGYYYTLAEYHFLSGNVQDGLSLVQELEKHPTFKKLLPMSSLLQYVFPVEQYTGPLVSSFMYHYENAGEEERSLDSHLVCADVLIHRGDDAQALKIINEVLPKARKGKMKLKLIQASLMKIRVLLKGLKEKDCQREVQNLFREAIYYSYEDEIRQPFYWEKEVLHHLIQQFEGFLTKDLTTDEDRYFQTLLLEFGAKEKPLLSQREQEVLQEMSTGASNKEIAERLYISTATVKTHLINLYGKLHVNNRVAAIEAAKKRGMLKP
ncbi:MAG: hypothetical protein D5S00_08590 [Tindallia sp. MSAO_Bac2]|nr:MAG: hypothetical protein D5S00_08590 [Tindallia sp. MSAO_Bac2]